ncbi:MAG: hypothetical protein PHX51_00410 [Clostridia bacterium]|nr:hypothetical protein [Clostridia bacterium]
MAGIGKRVMLLGCAGAGKTTLSTILSEKYDYPLYHLDKLFWQKGWNRTPTEEWEQTVSMLADGESWIIDGNYTHTMEIRLKRADTVVYLDVNRWVCLYRVIKRLILNKGKQRKDLRDGVYDEVDFGFLKWIFHFNKVSRPVIFEYFKKYPEINYIILHNRKDVEAFLTGLGSDAST